MKIFVKVLWVVWIGLTLLFAEGEQQFARLGDFELENGQIIKDCCIGYRILGEMNADKSNIVLYPTWFGGSSEHVSGLVGPGKFVDNTELCVIIVDALGNGVSSSPSNSKKQRNQKFPKFAIYDMVQSQYKLLTEHLGIQHLYGIIGGSMGSFQVFEWLVVYPDFIDKALPYVCSPALSSYDLLQLQLQLEIIETARKAQYPEQKIQRLANIMTELFGHTPEYVVEKHPRDEFKEYLAGFDREPSEQFTSWNKTSQIRAMQHHNIFRHFGGSEEAAAQAITAELLIIVSATDLTVNPIPARKFAKILGCDIIVLDNNCGHLAIGCEMERCSRIVGDFFKR
ncbi:MAG: alpha/beta fold hydrolase [Candidatus Marinimicrobia bacterium]|nr:alpha/beta fold hydrolase [Candidatus Neomarinimicrobiota bacterium]